MGVSLAKKAFNRFDYQKVLGNWVKCSSESPSAATYLVQLDTYKTVIYISDILIVTLEVLPAWSKFMLAD